MGTTFRLYFQRAQAVSESDVLPQSTEFLEAKGETVLAVEDNQKAALDWRIGERTPTRCCLVSLRAKISVYCSTARACSGVSVVITAQVSDGRNRPAINHVFRTGYGSGAR